MSDQQTLDKKCLLCGEYSHISITDSRPVSVDGAMMSRRRKCHTCGETYKTHEVLAAKSHHTPEEMVVEAMLQKIIAETLGKMLASLQENDE